MKAKLLKIVRRRYSVVKVIKVGTKSIYSGMDTKPPFYLLRDSHSNWREWFHPDLDRCMEKLAEWIHRDYSNSKSRDRWIEKSIWYNNPPK